MIHHLYAEVASVYVVAEEEVLGGGRGTSDLEELHQVVELAVDVSADWKKRKFEVMGSIPAIAQDRLMKKTFIGSPKISKYPKTGPKRPP